MQIASVVGAITLFVGSMIVSACGSEANLGDCPPNSEAQQALGQSVLKTSCLQCHSSQLTGSARNDAPEEYNFDDLEKVRDEASEIYGEVEEGEMPPSPYGRITGESLENLRIWLACGAKETSSGM